MVLPYGADNNPDQFFDNIYIDKVDNGDELEYFRIMMIQLWENT